MAEAGRTTAFEHAELAANRTKPGERRLASGEIVGGGLGWRRCGQIDSDRRGHGYSPVRQKFSFVAWVSRAVQILGV
jgi:hypothetical protein